MNINQRLAEELKIELWQVEAAVKLIDEGDLNQKICYCFNVTVGDIKKEIESGSTTLQEIQSETKAGTACKGCVKRLQETIDALLAEKA